MIKVDVLKKLLDRLYDLEVEQGLSHIDRMTMGFQLVQVSSQIDFDKLEKFDDTDFYHDMQGINAHVLYDSNEFQDCFCPRCAK